MRKSRLFIASSVESLNIAEAVNVNLDHEFEVTIWKNGTFRLSSLTIDDLVAKSSSVDFALFIFTPDDIATIRKQEKHVVRDNVLFELGLFIGSIGKERSFILKPRDEELYLPTDLLGITPADYDAHRSDGDLASATNRACSLIKSEVKRLGQIKHIPLSTSLKLRANPESYELSSNDLSVLGVCLYSHTVIPQGLSFNSIREELKDRNEVTLRISAIKLERMGYLEKIIDTYENEYEKYDRYYYKITEHGIDVLLKNQNALLNDDPF